MLVRAFIANIAARQLALRLSQAGLAATVQGNLLGVTPQWGIEKTAMLESMTTDAQPVKNFVVQTLRERKEAAAYMTVDNVPFLLYADGHEESAA